jgi:hypothetical protein
VLGSHSEPAWQITRWSKTEDVDAARAVLNSYLQALEEVGITFDTVRCAFVEGPPVFPGSGIHRESHIQVAVRNPACTVGLPAHARGIVTKKRARQNHPAEAEPVDAGTSARRAVLAKMREMTPAQLLELGVRAGITRKMAN